MKILYLHGLESKLSPPKRKVLENHGEVFAPDIDYHTDSRAIETILTKYSGVEINTVIGSSMGGFAGFHIADALDRPALLFNPALRYRTIQQEIPVLGAAHENFKHIVLGQSDEVVNPADTLSYLRENLNEVTDYHINIRRGMQHRVSLAVFEEELEIFFGKICR